MDCSLRLLFTQSYPRGGDHTIFGVSQGLHEGCFHMIPLLLLVQRFYPFSLILVHDAMKGLVAAFMMWVLKSVWIIVSPAFHWEFFSGGILVSKIPFLCVLFPRTRNHKALAPCTGRFS